MNTNKIYSIKYLGNDGATCWANIRAESKEQARRILKSRTGCLIKDMKVDGWMGCNYRADNDAE